MTRSITAAIALAFVLVVAAGVRITSQTAAQTPAELVLRNGRIVTVDDRLPEAQALAASGGKIVFIGTNADVARFVGPSTKVIDLGGQLAIPGLIEGHGHFTGIGENRINLDLMSTKSWDEIVQMVAQAVEKAKPGEWIIGRGWHQEKWTGAPQPNVEGFPLHASLDKVSPNNPVVLTHASGHASFVNQKAMDAAGITKTTANPDGGEILKDSNGNPTGLLREKASGLIHLPAESEDRGRRVLQLADEEVTSKGITSFVDAGSAFDVIERMKRMVDENKLNVRLWVMVSNSTASNFGAGLDSHRMIGYGDNHLTVRAIKMYMDGALGSRGAWLLEPYTDKPDSTGLNTTPLETIRAGAQTAIEHNYQVCVHAIGDRGNREVLNIYEDTFKKNNKNGKDLRWRIEHAQHISAADIPRFGQMGVIAAMQTNHCTSDAVFVPARLGDKRSEEGAYVWQKLMKSGAVVADGTDAPVENVDPIPNYYAAVTRKLADGRVFYGDQKMSRMEALKSYTLSNAFATFEENLKGSLTVGKLADITVLTKDITKVPDEEIRTAKVAYTIVGGKVVYQAK
ncbi:MAG TPA: amidohydrolase [Vicinamibacterales bacterium]|nr:amidohydrolase [Vicinamibacterales bacterium]